MDSVWIICLIWILYFVFLRKDIDENNTGKN